MEKFQLLDQTNNNWWCIFRFHDNVFWSIRNSSSRNGENTKFEPVRHLATHSALMSIQHLIKVVVFGLLVLLTQNIFTYFLMIISGFAGTILGKKF